MPHLLLALVLLLFPLASAQNFRGLALYTPYPSQSVQTGETITLPITVRSYGLAPQSVSLRVQEAAPGWRASLLGGGRLISAVYLLPDGEQSFSLQLVPPQEVRPGTYRFRLVAEGTAGRAELPISLTLGQSLPKRLSLQTDLPVLRGTPTASFRYRVTLRNESDQDLLVNLEAQAPQGFQVSFTPAFGGQETTSLPIKAGESRDLDVQVTPPQRVEAKVYAVTLRALAGEARGELVVNLDITGQPQLLLTTPEGRLSGPVTGGRETPVKFVLRNTGSAAAENVSFSSSEPSGWEVKFEPEKIENLPAGEEAQLTVRIKPAARAVAGDYLLTLRASAGSASTSVDYRTTVQTSTLWGLVGVALVAVAVIGVGLAVARFGRR
ncbi:NEW3 domain-containing protein [Meiothermus rufus]|uniref:COG1470 family protein n=1 Tax=Meiothermus rufus TaxID=604332 RepID=UPI000419335C|nr:NEW3 domain-containing protein [Meiothermus rufus]